MGEKTMKVEPKIESSWMDALADEFAKPYMADLKEFLLGEKSRHTVYPPADKIFNAFNCTPFDKVRIVILGQDPYHGPGQAHGLCFSVPIGIPKPPSLLNIFKELNTDLGIPLPSHGNLEAWAKQGVFLLNTTLTVRADLAGSHQGKGWETFTDAVIQKISDGRDNVVFMLWGRFAQSKIKLIDPGRHLVLQAAHPSPLSAYNGFFGCRHFSKANTYLAEKMKEPIMWDCRELNY
jgi:uracil-DNA glycosylase